MTEAVNIQFEQAKPSLNNLILFPHTRNGLPRIPVNFVRVDAVESRPGKSPLVQVSLFIHQNSPSGFPVEHFSDVVSQFGLGRGFAGHQFFGLMASDVADCLEVGLLEPLALLADADQAHEYNYCLDNFHLVYLEV